MKFLIIWLCLLFTGCYGNNSPKSISNDERKIPSKLPKGTQWYGGVDGGSWFFIEKLKSKNEFRIRDYFEDGALHWDAVFTIDHLGLNLNETFCFISKSDYSRCTIKQETQTFILLFSRNFRVTRFTASAPTPPLGSCRVATILRPPADRLSNAAK